MSDFDAIDALLADVGPQADLPPAGLRCELRERARLSRAQVARALEVSPSTVGAWEGGRDPVGATRTKYAYLLDGLSRKLTTDTDTGTLRLQERSTPPRSSGPGVEAGEAATPAAGSDTQPCVLCGRPASDVVEGFVQHLNPDDCAPPGGGRVPSPATAPEHPESAESSPPEAGEPGGEADTEPAEPVTPAPATAPTSAPTGYATDPARSRPAPSARRPAAGELPVDEIHQVVVEEATKAGGDFEAATAALVKRAIPDAMALWALTRVGSRYDVLFRPPRPDILKKHSRNGADDIWEARPKWRNPALATHATGPARDVTTLDVNGAYLAAMKAHLPHKVLEHDTTGSYDRRRSGVYLITPPTWPHDDLPNPIGNRDTPGELWVTDATLRLLLRVAGPRYELCQPPAIHESWTSAGSESLLEKFRQTLAAAREEAITCGDPMTQEYVKAMYSKFVATCGESSHNRDIERPEWMHIIHSQAFANLWWKAYKAREAGLTVVKMAGTDELHVTGGDWRAVFPEGRGLAEVKVKDTYTLAGAGEGGES